MAKVYPGIHGYAPGLAAGLAAAVAVVLVSLPLHSPHDALMNSGTIGVAAILAAVVLAVVWQQLESNSRRPVIFAAICAAGFVGSVIAAVVVQEAADLERTVSFVVPLSALQFGITAALAPAASNMRVASTWIAALLLVAVIALGAGFATHGDQKSGRLELPARTK